MRYDFFLTLRYWKKHKKQAFAILLTYMLLIVYFFVSLSMIRTELRRIYFDSFSFDMHETGFWAMENGGYNLIFYGVSEDKVEELAQEPLLEECVLGYTSGYMGQGECLYTAGCYPNKLSSDRAGIRFRAGKLPQNTGEIALSELAMDLMGITEEIGEEITLSSFDENKKFLSKRQWKLTGIIADDGKRDSWETGSNPYAMYFEPVILVSEADFAWNTCQINAMLRIKNGDGMSGIFREQMQAGKDTEIEEESNALILNYLNKKYIKGFGMGAYDSSYFANVIGLNEDYEGYLKTAKSNFYQYAGFGAAVLMVMTLICALRVILPERMSSLRLLQQTGYSLRRLCRMLLLEWLLFTAAGVVGGLLIGMLSYEVLLQLQHSLLGLDIYRAYSAEWGIRKITFSPIWVSLTTVCIASFTAYAVLCISLKKLLLRTETKKQRAVPVIQCVSLVLVLTMSCTALMFFSINGKSSKQNPQLVAVGEFFKTDLGIERRDNQIDCTFENARKGILSAGLMMLDSDNGYTREQERAFEESGLFTSCIAWSELWSGIYACYPKGTEVSNMLTRYEDIFFGEGEKEWYGLEDYDVYEFSRVVLVNDFILNKIAPGVPTGEGVMVLSLNGSSPCEEGEELPFFSGMGTPNVNSRFGYDLLSARRFKTPVTKVIYPTEEEREANALLYQILCKETSDYVLLFPISTAVKEDICKQSFDHVYLQYAEGTTDRQLKKLAKEVYQASSYMQSKTLTECREAYNRFMLKEYVIVFTVFGLLFLLAMIGYFQTLRLQIYQQLERVRILRALGMSRRSVCRQLFLQCMKVPFIAGAVAVVSVALTKLFFYWRYTVCQRLFEIADAETRDDTEIYIKFYTKFTEQREHFLTAYEMWKVPVGKLFLILFVIILIWVGIGCMVLLKSAIPEVISWDEEE